MAIFFVPIKTLGKILTFPLRKTKLVLVATGLPVILKTQWVRIRLVPLVATRPLRVVGTRTLILRASNLLPARAARLRTTPYIDFL